MDKNRNIYGVAIGLLLAVLITTIVTTGNGKVIFGSVFAGKTVAINHDLVAATADSVNRGVVYQVTSEPYKAPEKVIPTGALQVIKKDSQALSYIVQLTEEPLAKRFAELQSRQTGKQSPADLKANIDAQKERVVSQQDSFLSSVKSLSGTRKISLQSGGKTQRFDTVLNAVVLNMNEADVAAVKKLPNVKSVDAVQPIHAFLMDSVPLIHAPRVWIGESTTTSLTGKGIKIAIIDTGVDYTHPDLGGCLGSKVARPGDKPGDAQCKVAGGYDFINNDNDPMDDMGHGTHVAAIAAGNGALKGVAPDATIYAYKVLDEDGSGSWNTVISGLEKAADPNGDGDFSDHMDVASLSLGGWGDSDDPVSIAADNTVLAGVIVTIAAGNSGPYPGSIGSPGAARTVITVGASDKSDNLAEFSSRGPVTWYDKDGIKNYLVKPDVTAPGVNICAAQFDHAFADHGNPNCNKDNNHVAISGTSMATPHVAGEAALLKQEHPDWSPAEIKMVIRNNTFVPAQIIPECPQGYKCSGTDSSKDVNNYNWGHGRIDLRKAVQSNRLPIAQLDSLGEVKGTINIKGVATTKDSTTKYTLSIGSGKTPNSFKDFYSGNKSVHDGVLVPSFDTTGFPEGLYTIKLTVTDASGNISTDFGIIEVNNISIKDPQDSDIYSPGSRINIIGSINGSPSKFTVEYMAETGTSWGNQGIILTNGGVGSINNNTIATWDTSSIKTKGFYGIRVLANYGNNISSEQIGNIYFDPSLHNGWPVHVNFDTADDSVRLTSTNVKYFATPQAKKILNGGVSANSIETYIAGDLAPTADDLNNDGKKEIIINKGGIPPKLLVYKEDGSLLWSKNIGTNPVPGGNYSFPIVGDANNDGYDDIITYNLGQYPSNSELYAFAHDGSLLWESDVPKDYQPTMAMADLNHDGKKEIIVQGNGAAEPVMYVVNAKDGKVIQKWSLPKSSWGASVEPAPSVGNFDSDDDLEIVSITPSERARYDQDTKVWTNEALLYVYKKDGTVLPGFPVSLPGSITSSPVVGDIDGDGKQDIVVGLTYTSENFPEPQLGGLYAIDRNGKIMPGWPVLKGYNFWSTPSLSDMNNDGHLEIAASRLGFLTYIFDYKGNVLSGWPKATCWNDYYSSIMSDVNNDNKIDLLTTAGNGIYNDCRGRGGVYGWNSTGTSLESFPKLTEMDAQAPAAVTDIMGNGRLNLIASSDWDMNALMGRDKRRGSIYLWDLNSHYASATTSLTWPTYKHDNQRTGCLDCDTKSTLSSTTPVIILSASPDKIHPGESATINWSAKNATVCKGLVENDPEKAMPTVSSIKVSPKKTTEYILTCTNDLAKPKTSSTEKVTVTVYSPFSVVIEGTSTLAMHYDPSGKEDKLMSTYKVRVNAGDKDKMIMIGGGAFRVYLATKEGLHVSGPSMYDAPYGVTKVADFLLLPANKSALFTVVTTFQPGVMFAGEYHGVMDLAFIGTYSNMERVEIKEPNTTNSIVVIGELSPYINEVAPNPVAADHTVKITGVRFSKTLPNIITLTSYTRKGVPDKKYSAISTDGLTLNFVPNATPDRYGLQVTNPKTGDSNYVEIVVTASTGQLNTTSVPVPVTQTVSPSTTSSPKPTSSSTASPSATATATVSPTFTASASPSSTSNSTASPTPTSTYSSSPSSSSSSSSSSSPRSSANDGKSFVASVLEGVGNWLDNFFK